jgi:hypothetical protein
MMLSEQDTVVAYSQDVPSHRGNSPHRAGIEKVFVNRALRQNGDRFRVDERDRIAPARSIDPDQRFRVHAMIAGRAALNAC